MNGGVRPKQCAQRGSRARPPTRPGFGVEAADDCPQHVTGCEGADCGRAMHEGEVLFEVLPACECILGDELLVQAGVSDVVHDRHRRDMAHVPAAAADPETEIGSSQYRKNRSSIRPAPRSASRRTSMNDPDVQSHSVSCSYRD